VTRHHSCRVSPFGHPRIHARLTTPRGISQPPTSFIGSQCQGIHHAPLNTYKHKTNSSKLHINTQQSTNEPLRARCSQPLSTNQTPHPTTKDGATTRTPNPNGPKASTHPKAGTTGLLSQSPIVCLMISLADIDHSIPNRRNVCCAPSRGHYSHRLLHGSHPRTEGVSRGAP
jgi:hypothetical protein